VFAPTTFSPAIQTNLQRGFVATAWFLPFFKLESLEDSYSKGKASADAEQSA